VPGGYLSGKTPRWFAASLAILLLPMFLGGCAGQSGWWGRRQAPAAELGSGGNRQQPALSGNGKLLATIGERQGRPSLLLQRLPDGQLLPLPQLRGHEPHSSPALSWNGRYVAALVQRGDQRLAVIVDRVTGRLHQLPLPGNPVPLRLSLAPNGQRLAIQLLQNGGQRVQLFDLSALLEADLPAGQPLRGADAGLGPTE
jgi:hypothetical protein